MGRVGIGNSRGGVVTTVIIDEDAVVIGDVPEVGKPFYKRISILAIIAIIGWLLAAGEAGWIYREQSRHKDTVCTVEYLSLYDKRTFCALGMANHGYGTLGMASGLREGKDYGAKEDK